MVQEHKDATVNAKAVDTIVTRGMKYFRCSKEAEGGFKFHSMQCLMTSAERKNGVS